MATPKKKAVSVSNKSRQFSTSVKGIPLGMSQALIGRNQFVSFLLDVGSGKTLMCTSGKENGLNSTKVEFMAMLDAAIRQKVVLTVKGNLIGQPIHAVYPTTKYLKVAIIEGAGFKWSYQILA